MDDCANSAGEGRALVEMMSVPQLSSSYSVGGSVSDSTALLDAMAAAAACNVNESTVNCKVLYILII